MKNNTSRLSKNDKYKVVLPDKDSPMDKFDKTMKKIVSVPKNKLKKKQK